MRHTGAAKKPIMAVMLIMAAMLTFCFHGVLGTNAVFTHMFYIPIILGALWWGRRAMAIPLLLVGFLIANHWIFRKEFFDLNDYFRAAMFVVVSWVVVVLHYRIQATEAALEEKTVELQRRVRALSCLHAVNRLREKPNMTMDDIFGGTVELITEIGLDGTNAQVRITYQDRTFASKEALPPAFRINSPIMVDQHASGELEVFFAAAPDPGSFELENVRELTDTIAGRLGKVIEHENARAELDRYHLHLEELVRQRTEELVLVNRRLQEEIIEHEKTNASLRESENKYRLLFENANEAILIEQEGAIRLSNPALSVLSGFSTDQMMRTPFVDLVHPADRETVAERLRQRQAGAPVPASYIFRLQNADETSRWVEINSVLFAWQGQPATLNYLRDITDQQKLAASIGHIQKMEAIGVLAGGVAHKFNNTLSGITGNIELLKYSFPNNRAVAHYCEAVFKAAQEMIGLVRQLLAYARGGRYQSCIQSLIPLVKDVALLIRAGGDKHIDIGTELSADTPQVEIDAVQLRMVLLAVLNNASEAIEKDGRIRIETFPVRLDEAAARAFMDLPPGFYAVLSISDNGRGMSEEVCTRIFEPFFSTKFIGRGLGMAAAYGIIKNHGGYIFVDSEPGRGTVVNILLPA